jgi:hypothetical protein
LKYSIQIQNKPLKCVQIPETKYFLFFTYLRTPIRATQLYFFSIIIKEHQQQQQQQQQVKKSTA